MLCVTGPRQSGKTTLVRTTFPDTPYLSLEDPDIARLAREDPRGLLRGYGDCVILDEAQACPEIFAYLKTAVDADPRPGKYIVTGSQRFGLMAGVTESLAGRAAFLTLLPFSVQELKRAKRLPGDPFQAIVKGFYPPLYDRNMTAYDWYTNYIASYVERDVRSVLNVKDLGQFQTFVKMCAARMGQLLTLSALALDCGLSHNTAKAWLSVLDTSGIVYLLKPHHKNFGKRLVKNPKLYFVDPGLVARLLGIKTDEECFIHPNRGSLFESFIVAEFLNTRHNRGLDPDISFWRDSAGVEVDVVFEGAVSGQGRKVKAIEIKSGKTFSPEFAASLETWLRYAGADRGDCSLVYARDRKMDWKDLGVLPCDQAGGILI